MKDETKTRGRKKFSGASLVITLGDWYGSCEAYSNIGIRITSVRFFKSSRSSHLFSGTKIQQQSFGRMLKSLIMGNLKTQM